MAAYGRKKIPKHGKKEMGYVSDIQLRVSQADGGTPKTGFPHPSRRTLVTCRNDRTCSDMCLRVVEGDSRNPTDFGEHMFDFRDSKGMHKKYVKSNNVFIEWKNRLESL